MKGEVKDATYFDGIARIIASCGEHNVVECHFADVSIFRLSNGSFLPTSRKPPHQGSDNPQESREEDSKDSPRRFQPQFGMTDEKRALLDEQRRYVEDKMENLDLEDPVEADRIARAEADRQE